MFDDKKNAYRILILLSLAVALLFKILRNEPLASDMDVASVIGVAIFFWLVSAFFVKYWSPRAGYIAMCVFIVLGYAGLYAE